MSNGVRNQLLTSSEADKILVAMERRAKGKEELKDKYGRWLSYSGIEPKSLEPTLDGKDGGRCLLFALFDLGLGQHYKLHALSCYTEIHTVREMVAAFFLRHGKIMSSRPDPDQLWWDGIGFDQTPHKPWTSAELKKDKHFLPLLQCWLEDGKHLQTWLSNFEKTTIIVNNPDSEERVFSRSVAIEVSRWAEVRFLARSRLGSAFDVFASATGDRS